MYNNKLLNSLSRYIKPSLKNYKLNKLTSPPFNVSSNDI